MKVTLSIIALFLATSFFPNPVEETIKSLVKDDMPYLVDFYKVRHQHPEVSLHEKETAAALAKEIKSIGFEVTENFGGYGVVGIFRNGKGPTILYRTDMDALPMKEKTGLAYQSKDDSAMHSCGHDMHMTTWVGVARAMIQMKDKWKGTLMLIGQPAEELGAGAKLMIDAGLYETFGVPTYGIGLHANAILPIGSIGIAPGYTMANAESITIKVFGQGAHGASPHMSIDPIVVASDIVMNLQTVVSRSIKPSEDAVITVGSFQGGTAHNIIPDEVELKLTVRTFKEAIRLQVHDRIRTIARGAGIQAGLSEDKLPEVIIPDVFTPSNYNDPALVEKIKVAATPMIGADKVLDYEPLMLGEDFARYGRTEHKVPTTLFWLGTVTQEKIESGNTPGLHSPFYYPEIEKSIETGVEVVTASLISLFSEI